ncbi:MAG: S1C family serine protease [Candidatus Izemoplasmataceae bacterium]
MITLILLSLLSVSLLGCEYLIPMPESKLQSKLMSSRDIIRSSNVGVFLEVTPHYIYESSSCSFESKGSGIVYRVDDNYYYALTNFHVINSKECENADLSVYILDHEDEEDKVSAYVIATDEDLDLAVIRFLRHDFSITPVDIYARLNDPIIRGELVLSVGNPSGIDSVVTYGEFIRYTEIEQAEFPVIYHSAMIYSGNSGGALTDIDGALLGINTWGNPSSIEGLAIPLDKIHEFLTEEDLLPET